MKYKTSVRKEKLLLKQNNDSYKKFKTTMIASVARLTQEFGENSKELSQYFKYAKKFEYYHTILEWYIRRAYKSLKKVI